MKKQIKFFGILFGLFLMLSFAAVWGEGDMKYNNWGFDTKTGIHESTREKHDEWGFDINGIHEITHLKISNFGYDWDGYTEDGILVCLKKSYGFGKDGYDHRGYDIYGKHKETNNEYNSNTPCGVDRTGFRRDGTFLNTGKMLAPDGRNINGMDKYRRYQNPRTKARLGGRHHPEFVNKAFI